MKIKGCRYLLCAEVWLTLMVHYMYRTNLSVAIIAMTKTSATAKASECAANNKIVNASSQQPYDWTEKQQGLLLASFFYGYICTHVLSGVLAEKIGVRYTMMVSLFFGTVFTFLIVPLSSISLSATVACRIVVGFFSGPLYPCVQKIIGSWAPIEERTKLLVLTNTGNIVGLLATFGFGALIVNSGPDGWKYFFYFNGALGAVCWIFWVIFAHDGPWSHPYITDEEKEYIEKSLFPNGLPNTMYSLEGVPFFELFTSYHVYLVAMANFANNFILFAFLTGHAKFLHDLYGISIVQASLLSMIPFVANFLFQVISSLIVNHLIKAGLRSLTFIRKAAGVIGFTGAFIFLFPAGFLKCDQMTLAIALLSISMACIGINQSSFFSSMVDLAPNYSDIITGIAMTAGSVAGIVSPTMAGNFTSSSGTKYGWRYTFIVTASVSLFSSYLWIIFGTSEKQDWAEGRNPNKVSVIPLLAKQDSIHEIKPTKDQTNKCEKNFPDSLAHVSTFEDKVNETKKT